MRTITTLLFIFPAVLLGANLSEKCDLLEDLIEKGKTVPLAQISINQSIYNFTDRKVNLNAYDLPNEFAIRLIAPGFLQEEFGNATYFEASGIKVYKSNREGRDELIFEDSDFKKAFNKELIYGFKDFYAGSHYPGVTYEIEFNKLIQVDCSKQRRLLGSNWPKYDSSYSVFLHLRYDKNPAIKSFGVPKFILLANGKVVEEKQTIGREDSLSIKIMFPKGLPDGIKQSDFFVSGYRVHEQGCFGGLEAISVSKEIFFPFEVPNDSMRVRFGGDFTLIIDFLFFKDSNGDIYKIPLPRMSYYIPFRKRSRS